MLFGPVASDALTPVIGGVAAADAVVRLVAGQAGESASAELKTAAPRQVRRLMADAPGRAPVEIFPVGDRGDVAVAFAAEAIQVRGGEVARPADEFFGAVRIAGGSRGAVSA